jgi:hypothetical protein
MAMATEPNSAGDPFADCCPPFTVNSSRALAGGQVALHSSFHEQVPFQLGWFLYSIPAMNVTKEKKTPKSIDAKP